MKTAVRLALEVGDAAEVGFELLELRQQADPLLRGQEVELALALQPAQLVQVGDPVGDGAPVRQQAAEPAIGDVRHADAGSLGGNGVLRLLLRADEKHRPAAGGEVAREVVRLLEKVGGLGQIDDVDAAALREDEALHLRIPATGLVAEVDSGLQELTHGDNCQGSGPLSWLVAVQPAGAGGTDAQGLGTPTRSSCRGEGTGLRQCTGRRESLRTRPQATVRVRPRHVRSGHASKVIAWPQAVSSAARTRV